MTVEDMANGEFSSALQLCRMVTQWAKRTKLCHAFDIKIKSYFIRGWQIFLKTSFLIKGSVIKAIFSPLRRQSN